MLSNFFFFCSVLTKFAKPSLRFAKFAVHVHQWQETKSPKFILHKRRWGSAALEGEGVWVNVTYVQQTNEVQNVTTHTDLGGLGMLIKNYVWIRKNIYLETIALLSYFASIRQTFDSLVTLLNHFSPSLGRKAAIKSKFNIYC